MCLPSVPTESFDEPQDERRFSVKLTDISGIDIGITTAEFVVIAESPEEAEMYVRNYMDADTGRTASIFESTVREIPFI